MKYMILFVVVASLSFGLFLSNYLGAFKDVAVSRSQQGPFKTVYLENMGPYHKVNKVIEQVEKYMKSKGYVCGRTFGEYLDNPRQVEEARLRSRVGCLVESVPTDLPEDFKAGEIRAADYVVAVFTGSPGIGPLKVYPRAQEFMAAHQLAEAGAAIEIYEIHSITEKNAMTTTYLFPVKSLL